LLALLALTAGAPAAPVARDTAAVTIRLPADIVYRRAAGSDTTVIFSHETHVAAANGLCTACHPQTFHILKRGPAPAHAEMNAGRSCGTCHDGKQGFAVTDSNSCKICHVSERALAAAKAGGAGAASSAEPGARAPHKYPRGEVSPGTVTFKHATHQRAAGSCTACHTKLFKMAAEPPRPEGGMHESAACGACHDGRKAFGTKDAESCMRCHIETGGQP
jgi:c(7)-type cytochrome triheme protein